MDLSEETGCVSAPCHGLSMQTDEGGKIPLN
jgi:hypothetical protein